MHLFVLKSRFGNFWILRESLSINQPIIITAMLCYSQGVFGSAHRRLTDSFISLCSQCQHVITNVDLSCLYGFDHYYDALLNCHYSRPNVKTGFCGMYRRNAI